MDVTIETTYGGELTLRGVRFFATVWWIKEAIRDRVGIPVELQRLFFMGQELHNDRDMMHYSIHHGSRILLDAPFAAVPAPLGRSALDLQAVSGSGTVTPSTAVHVMASTPALGSRSMVLDLPASGSLMDLLFNQAERGDGRALADYNPQAEGVDVIADTVRQPADLDQQDRVEVAVPMRQPVDAADRMVVTLESHGGNTALLEVSALETPGEMRRAVAQMAAHLQPPEEYFFIHGQDIMRDERTLGWHDVRDGDTITLFPGHISSGT